MESLNYKDLPHYVYEDYVQWEGRWELIKGVPYAMSPAPVKYHQRVNSRIVTQLSNLLENCEHCEASIYIDYKLSEDTILQPDALVLCEPYEDTDFITRAPVIIFEILSPSTRRKDMNLKYTLYEKAGVKYYVIVDPIKKSCVVYLLENKIYKQVFNTENEKYDFDIEPCPIQFDFGRIW
jgi:Uma2 family endonuclease